MLALKGLLFSMFTLVMLTVVSLLVVATIRLIYVAVHRGKSSKTASK